MIKNCYSLLRRNETEYFHFAFVRKKSYTSLDYCLNLVRTADNENYLCTLLLPESIRSTALAIRALNVEVASVQDQVSQSNLGLMRMKFWEDSIDKIYSGKVPNNPVAVELAKAIQRHKLSKKYLKSIILSRKTRLDQPSFSSIKEMEDYASMSCGSIFLLLLEASAIKSQEAVNTAISLGKAQGLSNLLRGIPHCISKRQISLPSNLLAEHGVSEETVFRGNFSEELNNVILDVTGSALFHLREARTLPSQLPKEAKQIFLPAIPTRKYLLKLKENQGNVFDTALQVKNPFLPFTLYWHSISGQF